MSDNQLTVLIFALFASAPFWTVLLDNLIDLAKNKINRKLEPHGLRLRQRG